MARGDVRVRVTVELSERDYARLRKVADPKTETEVQAYIAILTFIDMVEKYPRELDKALEKLAGDA